jgi:predicted dehydrogenase
MSEQRIYLIGAGIIARAHASAIRNLPESEQVNLAVTDLNPQTLTDFCNLYPHARAFNDTETMLSEPAQETDIVIVATPPSTHFSLTCTALATGRHVLCEKPLAMDRTQANQMLTTARQYHRLLGCCSVRFLHWPPAEAARLLLNEQVLGPIFHVRFSEREQRNRPGVEYQPGTFWFLDASKSGGGTLMDRAPYEFTVLNDLFQPVRIEVLAAWLANPVTALHLPADTVFDVEQQAGATLRYHLADGSSFLLNYERASATHSEPHSIIEIEGVKGTLRWGWPGRGRPLTLTHHYDYEGLVESKTTSFLWPGEDTIRFGDKPLFYFYQRMLNQPSSAVVNEQAVFNFSCIRAIYDCASTGQPQTIDRAHLIEGA